MNVERLCAGFRVEEIADVRPLLFGHLVEISKENTHYLSDYYHDVHWLDKYLTAENLTDNAFTFFYGVRNTGTSIGTDEELVTIHNEFVWKVTLACDDRLSWTATFETIKGPAPLPGDDDDA